MASMAIANCRETPTSDVRCMWPSLGIIRQARLEARGVDTHMISREARLEARKLEKSSMRSSFIFWICGPRLLDVATGRVWDSFVLLPRILGCWGSFTRAFLPGRLVLFILTISYRYQTPTPLLAFNPPSASSFSSSHCSALC
jgi:hypothetical protein